MQNISSINGSGDVEEHRGAMLHDINSRVGRLEQGHAIQSVQLAVINTDLTYVKEGVGRITAGINRIMWTIGLAFMSAVITFFFGYKIEIFY